MSDVKSGARFGVGFLLVLALVGCAVLAVPLVMCSGVLGVGADLERQFEEREAQGE